MFRVSERLIVRFRFDQLGRFCVASEVRFSGRGPLDNMISLSFSDKEHVMNRAAKYPFLPAFSLLTLIFVSFFISFEASGQSNQENLAKAEDLNRQAILRFNEKRYDDALFLLKDAVAIDPTFASGWMNIGSAYLLSGRPELGVEPLQKGIRLEPDSHEGYNQLGVVYEKLGRVDEAVEAFKKAIDLKPDYALGNFNLGAAYLWSKKWKQAGLFLEKAAKLDPSHREVKLYLAVLYANQKKYPDAISEVKKVTQKNPDDDYASLILCRIYLLANDRDSALNMYQAVKSTKLTLADEMFKSIFSDRVVLVSEKGRL